ncbi:MAG: hypothetical protein ABJF26_03500 [Lentilitoribacter sp.]
MSEKNEMLTYKEFKESLHAGYKYERKVLRQLYRKYLTEFKAAN